MGLGFKVYRGLVFREGLHRGCVGLYRGIYGDICGYRGTQGYVIFRASVEVGNVQS